MMWKGFTLSKALLLKVNPEWADHIQTSIDDPRYYVVTNMMDAEVAASKVSNTSKNHIYLTDHQ